MDQTVIIGVSLLVTVVVVLGAKSWLHNLLTFKMDESAILRFIRESGGDQIVHSTSAIAAGTGIEATRVLAVCGRSTSVEAEAGDTDGWCLRN